MLDWQLFGLNPGQHHRMNVLIHTVNALLLLVVLERMTGQTTHSAFVAALFALHPLHVESVAWVAERKDVLSGFFWMLTLWSYVRYAEHPKWGRYLVVLGCFALGLMAKPMVVTLPFVLLLLDFWPLQRLQPFGVAKLQAPETSSHPMLVSLPRLLMEKLPLLALSVISSMVTLSFLKSWGTIELMDKLSIPARLANALISYGRYIGKMILPEDLSVVYPHPGSWPAWQVTGAVALLAAISLLVCGVIRRSPYLIVGWLWFLGTLVPVIGLVQVNPQSLADRYTYLPLIGLFIMGVWGAADLMARWPYRRVALGLGGALVMAGCMAVPWHQLRYWQNSITLFSHAANVTTNNAIAYYNLGQALSIKGQLQEPMELYTAALRIRPDHGLAHNNLGLTLARLGRWQEATNHYAAAIRITPQNDLAHFNYGIALATLGNTEEAIAHYETALRLSPDNYMAHNLLGQALRTRNQTESAIAHFSAALRLRPDYAEAHQNWGTALVSQNKLEEAISHFTEALRLKPNLAEAHSQLGLILAALGKTQEALAHYRQAVQLNPNLVEALNNLAWALATHPKPEWRNGTEAVAFAQRACKITARKVPALLGTLAAAYAEAGQFTEAVRAAEEARDLASSSGQEELAATNQKLLKLYQSGQPFHESL